MAVYTTLTHADIEEYLTFYAIGSLISFGGITSGVENTNYWIETTNGKFILTIYEKRVDKASLPFYLDLQHHLADASIPCPLPVSTKHGDFLGELKNKPAAIVTFLSGKSSESIQNYHLPFLGEVTAKLHLAAKPIAHQARPNQFSLSCWQKMAKDLGNQPDSIKIGLSDEIQAQLERLSQHWPTNLPSGVIHGDLFPDNVFYENNQLSGVIDFYFACNDAWMYDLAIILNAWCFENEREFNMTKARLLLSAYNHVRPITQDEWAALPMLASGAAMRFLLTRTHDWCNPVADAVVKPKDPLEYLHKLRFHHGVTSSKEYGV